VVSNMRLRRKAPTIKSGMFVVSALLVLFLLSTPAHATVPPSLVSTNDANSPAISLEPSEANAGAKVTVLGSSFRPNEKISLLWETVEGTVAVIGGYMYGGRVFQNRTTILNEIVTDGAGSFATSIVVPYDYGGYHQVLAAGSDGSNTSFTFFVASNLVMSPSRGPVGTRMVFTGAGFGWTHGLDDAWQVNYDNKYVGYFTATKSKGNVTFTLYASGDPGSHRIDVYVNPYGPTYLNLQEAFPEFARLPRFQFDYELTPGQPSQPTSEVSWDVRPAASLTQLGAGPIVTVDPASGVVGTSLKISGRGFKPQEDLNLGWTTVVGAYISPSGFINKTIPISSARADSSGRFETEFKVPYDVGGFHEILAEGSAGSNANSTFYVARSAEIYPTSGPPGTTITIRVYGVGWKSWENIVTVDYDNGYTGYACALGSQPGNITILLTAVGAPGLHTIDLHPSIFRGPPTINYRSLGGREPDVYRFPLLTPSELPQPVPIFHFEFIITDRSAPTEASVNIQYLALIVPAAAVAGVLLFRGTMKFRTKSKEE
jgi:hypothetical protein